MTNHASNGKSRSTNALRTFSGLFAALLFVGTALVAAGPAFAQDPQYTPEELAKQREEVQKALDEAKKAKDQAKEDMDDANEHVDEVAADVRRAARHYQNVTNQENANVTKAMNWKPTNQTKIDEAKAHRNASMAAAKRALDEARAHLREAQKHAQDMARRYGRALERVRELESDARALGLPIAAYCPAEDAEIVLVLAWITAEGYAYADESEVPGGCYMLYELCAEIGSCPEDAWTDESGSGDVYDWTHDETHEWDDAYNYDYEEIGSGPEDDGYTWIGDGSGGPGYPEDDGASTHSCDCDPDMLPFGGLFTGLLAVLVQVVLLAILEAFGGFGYGGFDVM